MLEQLNDAEVAALYAIVAGKRAWTQEEVLVGRGHGLDTLMGLVSTAWLERWAPPEGESAPDLPAFTLTPWAAEVMEVEIDEREESIGGQIDAVQHWRELGHAMRPIKLPRYGRDRSLRMPESIRDTAPGPTEYLVDIESGEVTREASQAAKILEALVPIDYRSGWGTAARVRRPKKRPKSGGAGAGDCLGTAPPRAKTRRERRAEARGRVT